MKRVRACISASQSIRAWLVAVAVLCGQSLHCVQAAEDRPTPREAAPTTRDANAAVLEQLPMAQRQDFEDAQRGFLAPLADGGVVRNAKGDVIYDASQFHIAPDAPAPETVNPSFWRICQLNAIGGLFQVVERIYQVRGLDLSNITFIEGERGVIVMDPCVSAETAKVALDLYYQHRPRRPVTAVIYSHSHVDHFGGVRGVVSQDDVDAGRTRIVAPLGFMEEAVSENVMAGNVMARRASYMYGNLLPKNAQGSLGSGLGTTASAGTITLIPPTDIVAKTGDRLTIDGLEFEFLYAPGSEAPAEMHFYIPQLKALCTAENAVHTMHNLYTLRGAKTRDVLKWVGYLNETLEIWGADAEVQYAPHHWPVWGNSRLVEHLEKYRDTFKYIHDQTLHMANQGYTMLEIAEMMRLPDSLALHWATRGYYGSVSHNTKAVYNFYLGYFSGNPADLHPLPSVEAARCYVEYMGGPEELLRRAQQDFDQGNYRWVAQVVNHLVLAAPENEVARRLQADALEQLGYQAESGPWRNFYLTGAQELRHGVQKGITPSTQSADIAMQMSLDQLFDYLAIRLNGQRAADKQMALHFDFTDTNQQYTVTVKNGVLNHAARHVGQPDAILTLARANLNEVLTGRATFPDLLLTGKIQVAGDRQLFTAFLGLLDPFDFWFPIVTSNLNK